MKETILLTDGYKLGHHFQYPQGTELVYSNWTPRSNKYFPEATEGSVVFGEKKRNIDTGKIESIEVKNPGIINNKPLTILDDLCDGGGTFIGLYEKLRQFTDKSINIIVTHMVNEKGLFNLANTFNKVCFTNSYKDWKQELGDKFPSNCEQINIV
jgi:phosphoribosylpyrophosphate synthetase